jgi:type VI secretion system protein ImpB
MSDLGSVAPKERVNIVYRPALGDAQEEVELPLKLLVIGDFAGRDGERPLEERKPVQIDKDNFDDVLASQQVMLPLMVPDRIHDRGELALELAFSRLEDFTPDALCGNVPILMQLLTLRRALVSLRGPIGNSPGFRRKLNEIASTPALRQQALAELAEPKAGGSR